MFKSMVRFFFFSLRRLCYEALYPHILTDDHLSHKMNDFLYLLFIFTVKSHNALVRHLKLLTNHEDFELRKLLFNILVVLSKDSTVVSVSHSYKSFLKCLVKYQACFK